MWKIPGDTIITFFELMYTDEVREIMSRPNGESEMVLVWIAKAHLENRLTALLTCRRAELSLRRRLAFHSTLDQIATRLIYARTRQREIELVI